MLPFTQIHFKGKGSYLWTPLTSDFAKKIEEDLKWKITPITRVHSAPPYSEKWFNYEKLQWRIPSVLEKRKDENEILSFKFKN
jgi:hypothetical protein